MTDEKEYVHKSGATEGDNTSHIHFIMGGAVKHSHPHTGKHIHDREARDNTQVGYEELESNP